MIDCGYACKEEATSANAYLKRKKGHFGQKFLQKPFCPRFVRSQTIHANGTLALSKTELTLGE